MEALNDAGIEKQPNFSERVGVYIGSGIGGLPDQLLTLKY